MLLVRERFPGAQAVIAGEVELDENLRDLVYRGGMASDLKLLGTRDDMPEVLAAFDVFVLSSHDEGMSNAVLEAMAMQLPVVATDVGGTGEVVRPRETGLLVPSGDLDQMTASLRLLLNDRDRARRFGKAGRARVEREFTREVMIKRTMNVYAAMLSE